MSDEKEVKVALDPEVAPSDSSLPVDSAAERRLLRKCDIHVIPILFVIYLISFLDRINIGNARIEGLEKDLRMRGSDYNVALLIFFVPYILLEVPSNLLLKKLAPSTWLSVIMFCWGIITMCQGFVTSHAGLVVCRFLLGVFEAGVFPGCIYLISMYYKRHEFLKRYTAFFCSGLVAGAFGGLFAFALAKMRGIRGYNGWRWIFIIEGLLTIVLSFGAKWLIPDWPETAKFLNPDEKALLARRLDDDGANARMDRLGSKTVFRILGDWKIWVGILMYIGISTSGYATAFFIPTILREFGYTSAQAQVQTIPVYVVCTALTLFTAWASDRVRHRYGFTIFGVVVATIGYVILLAQGGLSPGVKYMAVFFVLSGVYVVQPATIVWLSNNMGGHYKRAFSSAMQIGLGNIGGIIGSTIFLTKEAPRYRTGYGTALGLLLFCGLMCTVFFFGLSAENRKRDRGERDHRLQRDQREVDNLGDDHPRFRFAT
ncbi:MAG: hypothetical protein M1817_006581 [Caeruleum heppii]|nr:MAG: hypothetical protein M1817_006581 [Caeruleum heppii]